MASDVVSLRGGRNAASRTPQRPPSDQVGNWSSPSSAVRSRYAVRLEVPRRMPMSSARIPSGWALRRFATRTSRATRSRFVLDPLSSSNSAIPPPRPERPPPPGRNHPRPPAPRVIAPPLPRTHHDLTEPDRGLTPIGGQPEDPSGVMADHDQGHQPTTRETYRALLLRGFSPGEAANLTAYLAGLEVGG